jgi:hypothetical protein
MEVSMTNVNSLEIAERLGEKLFFSTSEIVESGLFGSQSGILQALNKGVLPFIRVSNRRFVIRREDLINYIEKNSKTSLVSDRGTK